MLAHSKQGTMLSKGKDNLFASTFAPLLYFYQHQQLKKNTLYITYLFEPHYETGHMIVSMSLNKREDVSFEGLKNI